MPVPNRAVYAIGFCAAKTSRLPDKFVMAAQAGPLTRALPLGVTVFAYPENLVTKRIILHTITSAKTRATAMLRQHAHTAKRYG